MKRYEIRYRYTKRHDGSIEIEARNEDEARELAEEQISNEAEFAYDELDIRYIDEMKLFKFRITVKYYENDKSVEKGFDYEGYYTPSADEIEPIICSYFNARISDIISISITKK